MKFGYPVWSEYCLLRDIVPHLHRMAFAEVIICLLVHNRRFALFIMLRNLIEYSMTLVFLKKSIDDIYVENDLEWKMFSYFFFFAENQDPIKLVALNGKWENCYR